MILNRKPRRALALAAILSLGLGIFCGALSAQSTEDSQALPSAEVQKKSPAAALPALPNHVFNAGEGDAGSAADRLPVNETPVGLFSKVLMFLVILTGLTYGVVHFARKGKINLGALKAYSADEHLVVSETRMLGNRQYLMVVEYGAQKMLLAVTPGNVQHLCFLETPYEDDVDAAIEEEYAKEEDVS